METKRVTSRLASRAAINQLNPVHPAKRALPDPECLGKAADAGPHPRSSLDASESQSRTGHAQGSDADYALSIARPADLVHYLLFLQEFTRGSRNQTDQNLAPINFFMSRAGGFHVLLLLLNAAYQKPVCGRMPGWPFGVLQARVKVSERSLRMLLADAVASGLVTLRPGIRDKRCNVYCLEDKVTLAWQQLVADLSKSVPSALESLDTGALADIDYHVWDPGRPACDQVPLPAVLDILKSYLTN